MPLIVGIDEAGYGPTLGPLVVAATTWSVLPAHVDADLWRVLAALVRKSHSARGGTLVVNDSKKVFDRKSGLGSLERSVLAMARAAGLDCASLAGLLRSLGAAPPADSPLPWEVEVDQRLPAARPPAKVDDLARVVVERAAAVGVVCCGLLAEVVSAEAFNDGVKRTHNKAAVLMERVLRLVHRATQGVARTVQNNVGAHIRVDRLGGRTDYHRALMQAFPERYLHVLEQSETRSAYRLTASDGDWLVEFVVDGDQKHLPIALASMTAKYVRELLMDRFNAYWRSLLPQIKPTAGYYTDAQRFLAEIDPILPQVGIPRRRFVREC